MKNNDTTQTPPSPSHPSFRSPSEKELGAMADQQGYYIIEASLHPSDATKSKEARNNFIKGLRHAFSLIASPSIPPQIPPDIEAIINKKYQAPDEYKPDWYEYLIAEKQRSAYSTCYREHVLPLKEELDRVRMDKDALRKTFDMNPSALYTQLEKAEAHLARFKSAYMLDHLAFLHEYIARSRAEGWGSAQEKVNAIINIIDDLPQQTPSQDQHSTLSEKYDALYDHLDQGGRAFAFFWDGKTSRPYPCVFEKGINSSMTMWDRTGTSYMGTDKKAFIAQCRDKHVSWTPIQNSIHPQKDTVTISRKVFQFLHGAGNIDGRTPTRKDTGGANTSFR